MSVESVSEVSGVIEVLEEEEHPVTKVAFMDVDKSTVVEVTNVIQIVNPVQNIISVVKGPVDWSNPVPIVLILAKEVEKVGALKGDEKLKLVQDSMLELLKSDAVLKGDEKQKAIVFIRDVLPVVIQGIVLASKSPMVKQVVEVVHKAAYQCIPGLFTWWRKRKTAESK